MNRDYKITGEKVISDGWGRLQAITYKIRGRDGHMQEARAELYDTGNAVAVLLYNKAQGTVILNRQFRIATVYNGNPGGMLTEVCAGKIENGLSPDETVRKEIEEETGYSLKDVMPVMKLYMSPGAFTEMLHFYVAAYTPVDKKKEGGGLKEEGEQIEPEELPYGKAMEMVQRGEINDAKTVLLLQYAGLHGLL